MSQPRKEIIQNLNVLKKGLIGYLMKLTTSKSLLQLKRKLLFIEELSDDKDYMECFNDDVLKSYPMEMKEPIREEKEERQIPIQMNYQIDKEVVQNIFFTQTYHFDYR